MSSNRKQETSATIGTTRPPGSIVRQVGLELPALPVLWAFESAYQPFLEELVHPEN